MAAGAPTLNPKKRGLTFCTTALSLLVFFVPAASAAPDFAVAVNPDNVTIVIAGDGSVRVSMVPIDGYTGPGARVVLMGPPSTIWGECITNITPTESCTLHMNVATGTAPGVYRMKVVAGTGSLTHDATLNVTVQAQAARPPSTPGLESGGAVAALAVCAAAIVVWGRRS